MSAADASRRNTTLIELLPRLPNGSALSCTKQRRPPTLELSRSPPECHQVPIATSCLVAASALLGSALRAEKRRELFDSNAGFADQRTKRSLSDFAVIGNCKPAKWRFAVAEDDVTALLAIDFVPELAKYSNGFAPGDSRNEAHTATSMTSSWIEGGIGSPFSRRLSR